MIYVTMSTGSGTGKTTISNHVLTAYLKLRKNAESISIMEIDNNNNSSVMLANDPLVEAKSSILDDQDSLRRLVDELDVEYRKGDLIIDAGGGDDTKRTLQMIGKSLMDCVFIVPTVVNDLPGNTIDTIALIKKHARNPRILVVLNRLIGPIEDIKNEFVLLYGNKGFEYLYGGYSVEKADIGVKDEFITHIPNISMAIRFSQIASVAMVTLAKGALGLRAEEEVEVRRLIGKNIRAEFPGEKDAIKEETIAQYTRFYQSLKARDAIVSFEHFFDALERLERDSAMMSNEC